MRCDVMRSQQHRTVVPRIKLVQTIPIFIIAHSLTFTSKDLMKSKKNIKKFSVLSQLFNNKQQIQFLVGQNIVP